MEKSIIKTHIGEKHYEITHTQLVKRPVLYEDSVCYVNVGIRRAGKSWLLYQDIQERISAGKMGIQGCLYVNFEDERLADITSKELGETVECHQ